MRVSEVAAVEVRNIDNVRMIIRIEHGKGGKDRYVMLSAQLLGILRAYWKLTRPQRLLFPGRDPDTASTSPCSTPHAGQPMWRRVSPRRSASIRCGIVLRRIFWNRARISGSSRRCSKQRQTAHQQPGGGADLLSVPPAQRRHGTRPEALCVPWHQAGGHPAA